MLKSGQAKSHEEYLEASGVDPDVFLEYMRLAVLQERLTRLAVGIEEGVSVTGEQQRAWLEEELAEQEGLDKIFTEAGFEWREAGCSMCLAMNADKLVPGERSASTSNRNFEGRQGPGGRTHLVSPAMAAAAAIAGHLTDVSDLD